MPQFKRQLSLELPETFGNVTDAGLKALRLSHKMMKFVT
jgi:hypothetical protein